MIFIKKYWQGYCAKYLFKPARILYANTVKLEILCFSLKHIYIYYNKQLRIIPESEVV